MDQQKGLAPILIVLLIALTVGGYLLYQQQSKPMPQSVTQSSPTPVTNPVASSSAKTANPDSIGTDWKTVNNNYGFSVNYPSNLKILGIGMQVDEITAPEIIISQDPGNPKYQGPYFHIYAINKEGSVYKNITLEESSKQNYEANLNNGNTFSQLIEPIKGTKLDGRVAYTYTILSKGFSGKWNGWANKIVTKLKIIESENDNKHYIIDYTVDNSTFDQILSTLKFTQ